MLSDSWARALQVRCILPSQTLEWSDGYLLARRPGHLPPPDHHPPRRGGATEKAGLARVASRRFACSTSQVACGGGPQGGMAGGPPLPGLCFPAVSAQASAPRGQSGVAASSVRRTAPSLPPPLPAATPPTHHLAHRGG